MLGRKRNPLAAHQAPHVALWDVLCAAGGRLCPVAAVGLWAWGHRHWRHKEKLPAALVPAARTGSFLNSPCFTRLYMK